MNEIKSALVVSLALLMSWPNSIVAKVTPSGSTFPIQITMADGSQTPAEVLKELMDSIIYHCDDVTVHGKTDSTPMHAFWKFVEENSCLPGTIFLVDTESSSRIKFEEINPSLDWPRGSRSKRVVAIITSKAYVCCYQLK